MTDTFVPSIEALETPLPAWLRRYGFVMAVYVFATTITKAYWMGDTVDYVESIVWFDRGVRHYWWDFAHLLWRPFGWLLYVVFKPVTHFLAGDSVRLNVILALTIVGWIAGAVCVIAMHALVRRIGGSSWTANAVCTALVFTQAFLNWAQTGSAYVPGLAFLLIALNLLVAGKHPITAGIMIAAAVCVWVPDLVAIPAILVASLVLHGVRRDRVRFALHAAITSAIVAAAAYVMAMLDLRFHSIGDVRAWIASSGHGIDYSGAKRMVFGFGRAFMNMGNDGLLFKRYLLHDPYNPVSFGNLVGGTLLKMILVYAFVGVVVITVARRRRVLTLLIVNAVPMLALALLFASSEPERYMPLFPMLFIAIAVCLEESRRFRVIAATFFAIVVATNIAAMARPVLDHREDAVAARVRELVPLLDARSIVFTATYQDDLMTFSRTFPFHPLNRSDRFRVSTLVSPGTSWNLHWCEDFASRVLAAWNQGGTTWISRRALAERPEANWNWAEGDDPRVRWTDFPHLFAHLDLGSSAGGDDGFVQLLPSAANRQFLGKLTTASLVAERQHQ